MARRATPPALLAVRAAVRAALAVLPADGLVLAACSGGADSLALAGALALEAPGRAGLVTVDHGLQEGSAARAAELAAWGEGAGLAPSVSVAARWGRAAGGGGPEAAAREARYAALDTVVAETGAVAVLLGHTRDDQAEQVLLGLARGSGARSLAGMPARRGAYVRPLLDLPRATVRQACADLGLTPWEDPHNADPAFARVRVRHAVLPLLEEQLGPGVAAALARSAALLAADAEALEAVAAATLARVRREGGVDATELAGEPAAVRTRVLRAAAAEAGAGAVTAAQAAALDALVSSWHGQGPVALAGGVEGRREHGAVHFARLG